MASCGRNDFSNPESSSTEEQSDSDGDSLEGRMPYYLGQIQKDLGEPCRYYNDGHCRDGKSCRYLHICKYAFKGRCRYGAKCRLKHPNTSPDSDESSCSRRSSRRGPRGDRKISLSKGILIDFSGPYKWQLNNGEDWLDIANDHILEAQFSQPNTKGIKLYNTPHGELYVDYKSMSVRGKSNLRVRRLDGQQTEWVWYYLADSGWTKYGEKDSKGNPGPVQSSEIESKFLSNPNGSLTFNISSNTFEIKFRKMIQVSSNRTRRVVRRPTYQPPQSETLTGQVTSAFQSMSMSPACQSGSPEWKYAGDSRGWYSYTRGSCSVSSSEIENRYQRNPTGKMHFTVRGQTMQLDFSAMTQTNLKTGTRRKVRRS
ncbi:hypothetical protein DPEC_G00114910 [Dallia pectoralis]|uniref:Uncharacterized protein n=1 Tax=Dallia pectoralis TaxID=75939 RepID=A0ACC2GUH5_DALPE|nr:hypothetical protein DPEC_G00114910 [Dallia pectoralis]